MKNQSVLINNSDKNTSQLRLQHAKNYNVKIVFIIVKIVYFSDLFFIII